VDYGGPDPHIEMGTIGQLRVLWLLALIAVIVGSLLPAASLPMRALDRLPVTDKMEHAGMYAALAFLPAIRDRRRIVIAAAAGAVALGVALEFGQLLTASRHFEIGDMIADAVGVSFGLALGLVLRRRLSPEAKL
jgi:VanZ family protein